MASAPLLWRVLGEAIDRGAHKLVADLSGVTFIDSSGLGRLPGARTTSRWPRGELIVVTDDRAVLRAIAIASLDQLLRIEPTLTEALVQFAEPVTALNG
jgi:anti-anti-sigma factor